MQFKLHKAAIGFIVSIIILVSVNSILAQEDAASKIRLKNPATIKGTIGGEAHDSYVIRARKGQTMTVEISWRRNNNNRAEFTVSKSANFFSGAPVNFGKESEEGKKWRGKITKNGNYYIYVVAHPAADYCLKVILR